MQLGMIGLGRMGANIVRRVMRDGHDASPSTSTPSRSPSWRRTGAVGATDPRRLRRALSKPRVAWVMIPAGITGTRGRGARRRCMEPGDIIIDGGNSNYRDDIDRAAALASQGHPLRRRRHQRRRVGPRARLLPDDRRRDGAWSPTSSRCSQVIAPGIEAAERTPGRTGEPAPRGTGLPALRPERRRPLREDGAQRHRVRHHGRLRRGPQRPRTRPTSAGERRTSTPPRSHPSTSRSTTSTTSTSRRSPRCGGAGRWWRPGCSTSPRAPCTPTRDSDGLAGRVSDSGEGRWTVKAAIDEGVPVPVLSASLFARFSSRGEAVYADKLLSAMRQAFGGHDERLPTGE